MAASQSTDPITVGLVSNEHEAETSSRLETATTEVPIEPISGRDSQVQNASEVVQHCVEEKQDGVESGHVLCKAQV